MGFNKPGKSDRPNGKAPGDDDKRYICDRCRKGFANASALAKHNCGRFSDRDFNGNPK